MGRGVALPLELGETRQKGPEEGPVGKEADGIETEGVLLTFTSWCQVGEFSVKFCVVLM